MLEREEIYQRVWGYAMAHGDRSVDVFVRKLRRSSRRPRRTGATSTRTSASATGSRRSRAGEAPAVPARGGAGTRRLAGRRARGRAGAVPVAAPAEAKAAVAPKSVRVFA